MGYSSEYWPHVHILDGLSCGSASQRHGMSLSPVRLSQGLHSGQTPARRRGSGCCRCYIQVVIVGMVFLSMALSQGSRSGGVEADLNRSLASVRAFDRSFRAAIQPALDEDDYDLQKISKPRGTFDARIINTLGGDRASFNPEKTFVVWMEGGKMRAQALWRDNSGDREDSIEPSACYISPSTLCMCGVLAETVNAPRPAARLYSHRGGRWVEIGTVLGDAEFGSREPFIAYSKDGRPVRVLLTTWPYPRNLSVAHAGPHLTVQSVWRVSPAGFVHEKTVRLRTALSTLDDISAAARSGNKKAFRRMVPVPAGEALWTAIRAEKDEPDVQNADDKATAFDLTAGGVTFRIAFGRSRGWTVVDVKRRLS